MKLNNQKLKLTFTLQQEETDCGVACLLSLIKYYGGYNSFDNLRKLSGTNISGTTLLGLYQAALKVGFDAEGYTATIKALIDHNLPCVLHVTLKNKIQHYIIFYGIILKKGKNHFLIGDPAIGIKIYSEEEIEEIWISKKCLTLFPNENFKNNLSLKNEKKEWFLKYLKPEINLLFLAIGFGIIISALSLSMALFSQNLIDKILPSKSYTKLYLGISLVFILLVIKEGISLIRQFFLLKQSNLFNIRMIESFYANILRLPKSFFDTRKIGELTARLSDTSRIQRVLTQLASVVVGDAIITIISIIFILIYSWKIGVFCLISLPLFYFLILLHKEKIISSQRGIMSSFATVESNYISSLQGIEPIKNFSKYDLFSKLNKEIYSNYQQNIFKLGKIQIKMSFLANSFSILFLCCILAFCSNEVLKNKIKIGELFAILSVCGNLLPSIANLALVTFPLNEAKIAFQRMIEFNSSEIENVEESNENKFNFLNLSVKKLSFRFPGKSQILKNISFEVSNGEIISLMGENGCGKSTLCQILQKYYEKENGEILLNNKFDLSDIPITTWRQKIGIVPQNIHIFNTSVLENIAFHDANTKSQEVIEFLKDYGFLQFLDALPQSIFTIIGEEGINLSGGQKQIIAIARALYSKPQILILDEATSAMDRDAEKFILNLLIKIKHNMGVILITHRLHILKTYCDRIYILENGETKIYGTHKELLQSNNLYSQYWSDLVNL